MKTLWKKQLLKCWKNTKKQNNEDMKGIIKIFKYSFYDVLRSRWTVTYFLFFLISTFALLYFSGNMSKGIVSLMNVTLTITPLISTIFGVMHYYNSREFIAVSYTHLTL